MANENDLDRIIDEGARLYADAQPPLGLEGRVLSALADKQQQKAWWRGPWLIAVPALAALVIMIALWATRNTAPSHTPQVAKAQPPAQATAGSQLSPRESALTPRSAERRPPRQTGSTARPGVTQAAGKPAQFPSPSAASDQERALAQILARGKKPVAVAEADASPAKEPAVELVQISAVQVQSLPDPNGQ